MDQQGHEIQLLGFDAKRVDTEWEDDRGDCCWGMFLLRIDLERPLSTDENVWESAIDFSKKGLEQPEWIGPYQDLWEDLSKLKDFIHDNTAQIVRPYWIIAITRVRNKKSERAAMKELKGCFSYDRITPPDVADSWEFLGYDVSDYFQLSGLMNCGYSLEDKKQQLYFKDHLNKYHLFDSIEIANEFREWSDQRVEEHAPFFVCGLYKISQVEK